MLNELDTVALVRDLPEHGLHRGDLGAVVHVAASTLEVEFVRPDGTTQALVTLAPADVRLVAMNEAAHTQFAPVK